MLLQCYHQTMRQNQYTQCTGLIENSNTREQVYY
uniref:Uncharacterized protein n=1 Tax=Anguilla anguilla TaxID=7936 RepID=A0A0E9WKT8_ANGAN